jgi:hypothetical protein
MEVLACLLVMEQVPVEKVLVQAKVEEEWEA